MIDPHQPLSMPPVELVARCLRGIEWICAAELGGALGVDVRRVEHRVIEGVASPRPALLSAGTVDDLFVLGSRLAGVDHRRSALAELRAQAELADTRTPVAAVEALRPLPSDAPFEVVASFLGRRNYNRFEIEHAVGEALERATGRRFLPGPPAAGRHPPLSWRVHLFDGRGFLGLRLSGEPLHRRSYRSRSLEGALHPPLAFAAAMLGAPREDELVVDPFCGAGTMLLEAGRYQRAARVLGADLVLDALRTARGNAVSAGRMAHWIACDAGRLALPAGAAGMVVTNPPWRRRVELAGSLRGGLTPFWFELARVTAPSGRIVVVLEELEEHLDAISEVGLEPVVLQRVAVSGAWTTLGLLAGRGRRQAELDRLAAAGLEP
jgi:23S rRNA G2445 N2-methylase RlmL